MKEANKLQHQIFEEGKKAIEKHNFFYDYESQHSKFMSGLNNHIFIMKCFDSLNSVLKLKLTNYYNKFAPTRLQKKIINNPKK